jgi:hypothetical protein
LRVSGNPVPHLSLIHSASHGVKDDPMLAMRSLWHAWGVGEMDQAVPAAPLRESLQRRDEP